MAQQIEYIVVQSGGKGIRMEYLTYNKPKALVPLTDKPILFHLFDQFPDKRFIIIGDYKIDVLKKYLETFAKVKYLVVDASVYKGTCAGMQESLRLIPNDQPFLLIWSDLVLPDQFTMPSGSNNYVGLSRDFSCRWSYRNNHFFEEPSSDAGVAGFFIFKNRDVLKDVPINGEFVKWLQHQKIDWDTINLFKTKEYGLLSEYKTATGCRFGSRCRSFNQIETKNDMVIKRGITEQGQKLALREVAWYKYVQEHNFKAIPRIEQFDPLVMERIHGKNVFEYSFSHEEKKAVLQNIVDSLKNLHQISFAPTDYFSIYDAYVGKTIDRLKKVRDMIPFANEKYITINGQRCPNIYFFIDELKIKFEKYYCHRFCLIHGDNTFSNMLLKDDGEPILIDPRGYFGYSELHGDPAYDWAKLYYSIVGNYDQFNLHRFALKINEQDVLLDIASNEWEDMAEDFFKMIESEAKRDDILLIHGIIWLSLTTYAWEDYDSVCGAFYNGLLYLKNII